MIAMGRTSQPYGRQFHIHTSYTFINKNNIFMDTLWSTLHQAHFSFFFLLLQLCFFIHNIKYPRFITRSLLLLFLLLEEFKIVYCINKIFHCIVFMILFYVFIFKRVFIVKLSLRQSRMRLNPNFLLMYYAGDPFFWIIFQDASFLTPFCQPQIRGGLVSHITLNGV